MSFPHSNNSLKAAIKQLKEVVSRHQGDDHETTAMVREIETIVADIERKTATMSIQDRAGAEQFAAPPSQIMHNPLPAV